MQKLNTMTLLEINFQDIQMAAMFVFFIAIAWLLAEFKGMKNKMRSVVKSISLIVAVFILLPSGIILAQEKAKLPLVYDPATKKYFIGGG